MFSPCINAWSLRYNSSNLSRTFSRSCTLCSYWASSNTLLKNGLNIYKKESILFRSVCKKNGCTELEMNPFFQMHRKTWMIGWLVHPETGAIACPEKRQSAPTSVLIKPIGTFGTQNAQKKFRTRSTISAEKGALCRISGHAKEHGI